eukprot:scaffold20086_cov149-Skeletonema_menzelii.AAC.3
MPFANRPTPASFYSDGTRTSKEEVLSPFARKLPSEASLMTNDRARVPIYHLGVFQGRRPAARPPGCRNDPCVG